MALKIKSIIVNRNNLALLGNSQVADSSIVDSQLRTSGTNRLKSLSQERNIKKIIRMIDSPVSQNQHTRIEMQENINHLEEQYENIKNSFGSAKNLKKSINAKGIPRSRIDLLESNHSYHHSRNTSMMSYGSDHSSFKVIPIGSKCIKLQRKKKGINLSIKELKLKLN